MRLVHQRGGDVGDDRRRSFRLRLWAAQGDAARPSFRRRVPPGGVDQQGERGSAKGPRGADGARSVLPLILGERIRAVPKEYAAGDFSGQSSGPRAAAQGHRGGFVRPASVSVAGTAPEGRAGVGDVEPPGARRAHLGGDADAARGLLASLPVDVNAGKLLVLASLFGLTGPATSLAAALAVKSPFARKPGGSAGARAGGEVRF